MKNNYYKAGFEMREAFNTFRTNLSFCGDDVKVIMVTSTHEDEGKSTVSFNLCKTMASDKKVLLLNADMRKPMKTTVFNIPLEEKEKARGLSHYLSGQAQMEETLCKTENPNVDVILAGPAPPNTPALLGSDRFKKLVEYVRDIYDFVILDCPPLGLVIDAAVVAKVSDGAIMVIEVNRMGYHEIQAVQKQLEASGVRILGAVLNKMPSGGSGHYKGYYKGYYRGYYKGYYKGYY